MADRILHVSIGPVQGFLAQSRRTRDLWAGSFLLSWLAGQLMAAALRRGGKVLFPVVGTQQLPTDPMLAAILGRPQPGNGPLPQTGTLPNRFKASVPETFDPEEIGAETRRRWQGLAEAVWQRFVDGAADRGRDTRFIWDRQIDRFWDIQWVTGPDPGNGSDANWLDRRKNWRCHWPPEEGGDHCTMMGDLQELSGFVRSRDRRSQDLFWRALQHKAGRLDIRDGERLSAVALVKRLFPRLKGQELQQAIGWKVEAVNWPSTAYMAAVPWLAHIAADPQRSTKLYEYYETVDDTLDRKSFRHLTGERATRLPGLASLGEIADLDGGFFLEAALANPRATPLNDDTEPREAGERDHAGNRDDPDTKLRDSLTKALEKLNQAVGSARPFYALLMMDGDRLGRLLRETDEGSVSDALARFLEQVRTILPQHDGVTIYAGGDDVLAILPVDRAIQCAVALRNAYGRAFEDTDSSTGARKQYPATASAAIVFSHYHNPLREVLSLAHRELDDTAKTGNGRDSLALTVMLTGGVNNRWVSRFGTGPEALMKLGNQSCSASFMYNLRQRYGSMIGDLGPDDRRAVVLAEYLKGSPPDSDPEREHAETVVHCLLDACLTRRGDNEQTDDKQTGARESFSLDGAFIARFVAEVCDFTPDKGQP